MRQACRPGVALVTGAARRIGRAIVRSLAADGWAVGVHYGSSAGEAEALAGEIIGAGGRAAALQADLADAGAVDRLVPDCGARLGPPTCLINNASIFLEDSLAALDAGQWDRQMAVNLRAPVFLARALAASLPAGAGGNVINILDQRVWRPVPTFFSYSLTKSALWAATRTLAQALAPRVRVNGVGPGPVLRSEHQRPEDFDRQAAATLLARATHPDEIAAAVRYILSAPAMTGQMIALDGGQHLAWETPDMLAETAARGPGASGSGT